MSKAVMRSAKPYWIYLILTGKKKVEVGKDFPKSKDWNKVVEMYCSKDMRSFNRIPENDREWMRKYLGKVACRFVCDMVEEFQIKGAKGVMFKRFSALAETCLSVSEMREYAGNKPKLYGWHISDLKIYDKPKELGEFKRDCGQYGSDNPLCDDCKYYICCKGLDFDESDCAVNGYIPITRPPQSWCCVEEV